MSGWRSVKLGSLGTFRNGLNFASDARGQGLAIVGVRDFQDHSFVRFDTLEQLDPSALGTADSLIRKNDILFVRSNGNRDLIGRSLFVKESPPSPTSHSGFTIRFRLEDCDADPAFFAYLLRAGIVRQQLSQQGGGTNINNLNQGILAALDVAYPPLNIQRRIAAILGAYDDLIEVNRRRLALTENMARVLAAEIIGRVPVGSLGVSISMSDMVVSTLGGDWGSEEPDGQNTYQVRVVRGTDFRKISNGDFSSCPKRYITPASALKRLLKPYDVILENSINAKTRSAGATHLCMEGTIQKLGGSVIAASFCRVFRFRSPEEAAVFHLELKRMHRSGEIDKFQVVAANGIANFQTTTLLREASVRLDPSQSQNVMSRILPFLDSTYSEQISVLTASRDLLLPRLISGQLSVAAAERELLDVA